MRIDARMKKEHAIGGIETGFTDLDAMTGGLHDSELIILAARPSMGKTALALNIAEHVAMKAQQPTLFVSLEMSSVELADRMLCSDRRSQWPAASQRHDFERRSPPAGGKGGRAQPGPAVRRRHAQPHHDRNRRHRPPARSGKNGLGLIVIDYLQLIEPDNPKDPRQEQVARIARRLKGLARELNVPVLCLAQLNRQAEATKDNRPRLSHLREAAPSSRTPTW